MPAARVTASGHDRRSNTHVVRWHTVAVSVNVRRTGGACRFADPRQVRELALGALAPGRHVRLELAREAFLPVGALAAVAVGVDHEGAELTHGRYPRDGPKCLQGDSHE